MSKSNRFTWKPGDIVWTKKGPKEQPKQTSAQQLADRIKQDDKPADK